MRRGCAVVIALAVIGLAAGCARPVPGTARPVSVTTVTTGPTPTATVTVTADSTTPPPSDPSGRVFDREKVEAGITQILVSEPPAGYGLTGADDVTCPDSQPVIAGTTFTCTLTVEGVPKQVTVTVKDGEGTYEVGVPQ